MTLALLFPGQGAQHPQMLRWLDHRPEATATLGRMSALIGPDWRIRLDDVDWLASNRIAQQLLTGIGLAAWQCLSGRLPRPAVVAGYSVGELAAFVVAGALDTETALALAGDRAEAMTASVAGIETGLLAVHGPRARELGEADPDLAVAIQIADERVIVGGPSPALDRAAARWTEAGMRCTRLSVRIASHTPWMARAAEAFAQRLSAVPLRTPQAAIVCNFSGGASRNPSVLSQALARQIASPVRWGECMDSIAERRARCVLEVGPGSTLAAMWRERHPAIPVRSVDEFRDLDGIVNWVEQTLR